MMLNPAGGSRPERWEREGDCSDEKQVRVIPFHREIVCRTIHHTRDQLMKQNRRFPEHDTPTGGERIIRTSENSRLSFWSQMDSLLEKRWPVSTAAESQNSRNLSRQNWWSGQVRQFGDAAPYRGCGEPPQSDETKWAYLQYWMYR